MVDEVQDDQVEAIFDPSMKKKKKKKKTPFDLDAALGGETQNEEAKGETGESADTVTTATKPAADADGEETTEKSKSSTVDDFDLEDFTAMKKKKKKKKTAFNMDGLDAALPEVDDSGSKVEPEPDTTQPAETLPEMEDIDITLMKKKKRKKKKRTEDMEGEGEDTATDGQKVDEDSELKDTSGTTWAGTERDYTYDELLTRVFDIMRSKNPDMVTGEKKRFVMRPPQVVRVGTKKSSFVNFTEICKMLHRPTEHLLNFLLAELGTSGSIDGNNQLIIKGRFQQKQMESVLRRYIKEYVTCHTCRSSETFLHKENRLFFLQCERCQSRCSVASIKSGFQAVTGKRAQIRAKAN
ncbi:eukaryotic translation initiation factor 2 subunit 2-like [Diadema antillarum]|uniref:eukaryotic translation initiation factor 2 subunit 2-like n=1 Tax=Diadema antillarum TaxID=105358 RepID=UPI003A8919A9